MRVFGKWCVSACTLTVAGIMCASVASAEMTLDGVIGYWPMEEGGDVEDVIGGNHGVVNGDVKEIAGKFGGALEFDGLSDVHIEGSDALNFADVDTFSVSVWANADSDAPVEGAVPGQCCGTIVAQRDVNGWALRYDSRQAGTEYEFIVNAGGWKGDGAFGIQQPPPNEWHHYVGVLDAGTMKMYFDGEFVMEEVAGAVTSVGFETEIGHAGDGGFVGGIDEVVIYSIALSDDQVMANFETPGLAVDPAGKVATSWASLKALR
ncbi:MAG: LamG domain-containing protein [Candidatus Poribacteria bacterium]